MDFREDIVQKYVSAVALTRQSCDSFDDFAHKRLFEIINLMGPILIKGNNNMEYIKISIGGGRLEKPLVIEHDGTARKITPNECRLRGCSYSGPLYVDIHVEYKMKETKEVHETLKEVYIGRVPIMVFSSKCHLFKPETRVKHGECSQDPGGYYIINGNEKAIQGQRTYAKNRMIAYKKQKSSAVAIKSSHANRIYVTTVTYKEKQPVMCTFPRLENEVPIMDILQLLGLSIDQIKSFFDTQELIMLEPSFENIGEDPMKTVVIREVYNVSSTVSERLNNALKNVLLPHSDMDKKKYIIINMIKKLLKVASDVCPPTDRDSLINQRIEMSCTLFTSLFHHLMIKLQMDIKLYFQKKMSKLKRGITPQMVKDEYSKSTIITDGFQYALATGNWNTTFVNRSQRVGVCQALQRLSLIATISQLRKVSSSVDASQNLTLPRMLHGTHWGRLCPAETPEGKPCGLETQLSVQAYVSIESNPYAIVDVIQNYMLDVCIENITKGDVVYVNGNYIGNTTQIDKVVHVIRMGRRTGQFPKDISICLNDHVLHISTTSGRICRPLLIVENGKLLYNIEQDKHKSWHELITSVKIEYLDTEEEDECLVAFSPDEITSEHTHCEISCAMINGLCAASIPFSDHNPGTRNTYQSAMGKQAQGVNVLNYQQRFDTTTNILQYGQKPLTSTKLSNLYGLQECPVGVNAIVAVMPFESFGQEDSVIFNQSALDRGFFRSDRYKTVKDTVTSNKDKVFFKQPVKKRKKGKYGKLDDDGIIKCGSDIEVNDCLIGKQSMNIERYRELSKGLRHEWRDESTLSTFSGEVDEVLMYQQPNGERGVKIRVRSTKIPEVGDKFSSRHGQKGTMGMPFLQEDMPWTIDGIVPDIIVNPHAFPSRMTIAHLIEKIAGKGACLKGELVDASPFTGLTVDQLCDQLHKWGFQKHGNEQLYSGFTGKPYKAKIFMGPVFYQRLKHMVGEKIHGRAKGRRNQLTKQPNEGRSHGGGLRVGEMEKDCFNSYGVPWIINERMFISSDKHHINVCSKCNTNLRIHKSKCSVCGSAPKKVGIPYAANLLLKELQSMCINVNLKVN